MSNQPEALRLAAIPIFERSITWQSQATIELRRLHEENGRLKTMLSDVHEKALAVERAFRGEKE